MKKVLISFLFTLLILCLLFFVYQLYRQYTHGTWKTYLNSSKSDCQMALPQNLKVVYNSSNKRYAIQINSIWGKQFLWARSNDWIYESFGVYTYFSDSCIAKSFAFQYLREQREYEEKQNGYK